MTLEFPAVSLAHYAERIGYRTCAFFGVNLSTDADYACRRVWSKAERDDIERYLLEAQEEIEQEVRFFLRPKWVTAERHTYTDPLQLQWGKVISAGVISDTKIGDSVAPNYAADPATITAALGTCDAADVRLFHEDTDVEITPTGYTVAGGNIVFTVPWCRLVAEDYWDNPENGWDYADAATWRAAAVDVRCISNSIATQGVLRWRHNCSVTCCSRGCSDYSRTACVYVRRADLGIVDLTQATYADGAWTATDCCNTGCCCGTPQWAEVSYYSGMQVLTRQAEDAVIRLAHAKMPNEPCGCDVTQRMWERDRKTPDMMTRERLNCPFGLAEGSWVAYRFAQAMRLVRGGRPL